MLKRWAGPLITAFIFLGVALILVMNLDFGKSPGIKTTPGPKPPVIESGAGGQPPPGETPIGEPVQKNHLEIAAIWLRAAAMDGMDVGGSDLIHLEADVKSTEGNPNGFALGEFVPYLTVHYKITTPAGVVVDQGKLTPMIASDGLHYGANVPMPKAGNYRLTYTIEPPSSGGLGRHSDRATGVAPWWTPFDAVYDWDDYPGPPTGK